ncbi:hypothetical protein WR25_19941 [Diploscapter pachys]|uniref:Solute carrier family 25 member 40 n=1 Tax=Diploscapter pachys TaxID=2018661 RepID=A0A2A2L1W4_9BILA|nr:hypothetical protein WR25_19941 [Diploscapter pachys]
MTNDRMQCSGMVKVHDFKCCKKPSSSAVSFSQQIASSCTGAMVTSILMTPMDVVKIRLQQQTHPFPKGHCYYYYNGLMDCLCPPCDNKKPCVWYQRPGNFKGTLDALIKIPRTEGILSLWSGLAPTLAQALPATIFYFSIYDNLRTYLATKLCCRRTLHPDKYTPPDWTASMAGGVVGRTVSSALVSPIEILRTKLQSEKMSYKELAKSMKIGIRTRGLMSFYAGWGPTILRDVPFSGIYWSMYDVMKTYLLKRNETTETSFLIAFTSGATSGITAAIITHPFDVVKTNVQVRVGTSEEQMEKSARQIAREIIDSRGYSGLMAGLLPRIFKVGISCAIMIGSYEYCKTLFRRRNDKKDS